MTYWELTSDLAARGVDGRTLGAIQTEARRLRIIGPLKSRDLKADDLKALYEAAGLVDLMAPPDEGGA